MMSSRPSCGERVAQRRDERQVPGGERVDPDDVHVGLDRLPRDLLRRLEQRAHVDVEAEVGERRGDHLLAAVVAVLAHLRHQDARAPALGGARTPRRRRCISTYARRTAGLLAVHAADRTDLRGVAPVDLLQRVGDLPDRGLRPGGVDRQRQQVGVGARPDRCWAGPRARLSRDSAARQASSSRSARSRRSLATCPLADRAVVDLEHLDGLLVRHAVVVDADHRLAAGVDPRLGARRRLLDPQLGQARLDGGRPCRRRPRPPGCATRPARPGRG